MSVLARFDLPPAEAIRFFRRKGLRTSWAWQDVWKEENEIGFTVAKMADLDLLADVRDAVDQALTEGTTLRQFKELLIPKMVRAGWWVEQEQVDPQTGRKQLVEQGSPRRLDTIFLTNMGQAYSAGEWSQIEEAANDAPYLMYDAVDDNRTREQHRAWDGIVLLVSDRWWDTHRPLNGYRCRCSTIQLSMRDLRAMGRSGPDQAPPIKRREWLNKRTGEVMQIPLGIDPGFDYNPGAKAGERKQRLDAMLDEKRQALRGDAP